jgi:hypothetical protein
MSNHKLGRLPNDPSKPRLSFGKYLKDTTDYPSQRDWLSNVSNWPMYLNDQIGDCTCAAAGHIIESSSTYGQGSTVTLTDNDILTAYEAVSGYDPKTGANDNGAVMQDVLTYWRKTGFGGHKILAFGELDVKNKDNLYKALNVFGTLYLGINFPESAMDQFDKGEPWDVVEGAKVEGGHAINAGFYDTSDGSWKIVTWGKVQPMTQAFFDKYVEEAWAIVTPEWFNSAGTDPTGLALYDLGQDLASLTGEANPFPAPSPSPAPVDPTPTPTPEPTPAPVDADAQLESFLNDWFGKHSLPAHPKLKEALQTWLASRA